jgi:hypothetical protein
VNLHLKSQEAGKFPFLFVSGCQENSVRKNHREDRGNYEDREGLSDVCNAGCAWCGCGECHAAEFFGAGGGSRRFAAVDFGGLQGAERLADRNRAEAATDAGAAKPAGV